MYAHFCCQLLDVCTQASLLLHLTKSRLCAVLQAPEMQSHITLLAPCNRFEHTQNWIYTVSQPRLKFVWQHSKDLAEVYAVGNKKFAHVTFRQKDSNLRSRCESCLDRNI
jgi:hypothetical protein